jgi:hypothetical protein
VRPATSRRRDVGSTAILCGSVASRNLRAAAGRRACRRHQVLAAGGRLERPAHPAHRAVRLDDEHFGRLQSGCDRGCFRVAVHRADADLARAPALRRVVEEIDAVGLARLDLAAHHELRSRTGRCDVLGDWRVSAAAQHRRRAEREDHPAAQRPKAVVHALCLPVRVGARRAASSAESASPRRTAGARPTSREIRHSLRRCHADRTR